jgi:hypothetical protein
MIQFHNLRHTAASLMLNRNIPAIVVSKRLGHAKPSTTLDIYGHLMPEGQDEAARLMDELITSIPVEIPSSTPVDRTSPTVEKQLHHNCTIKNDTCRFGRFNPHIYGISRCKPPHLGDPRRTRTFNQLIKSQLLCQIELVGRSAPELYPKGFACQLFSPTLPCSNFIKIPQIHSFWHCFFTHLG